MNRDPVAEVITQETLSNWVLEHVPAVADRFAMQSSGWPRPLSAYFMLSFVLKPHLLEIVDRSDNDEAQRIFDLLEYLATRGDSAVQNELRVMMEEVDIWKVWKFLGPTMREAEYEAVSWFPQQEDRNTRANEHVNPKRYQQRWREEIEGIGGFQSLSTANELFLRYELVREFGISGIRAPEPGGDEWIKMGLPWPYEPTRQD